ncbi:LIM zinc-binding domain-containing protein [Heracleum sosnowskyi]|uniref:LIM zinc-binding domain-containing protein n=1 Tax=Heracleum sosnowskyi TaxID=360622 RepID=A0AAD8M4J2_9APIA|nr:LIM zinc-binding domain-containing protein [Heracleum sosnowskyi]
MEYDSGYFNGGYGAFTFENPLSEDENQEMNSVDTESCSTEEDEHTGSTQGSMKHIDESKRKSCMTNGRRWWRKLFSSLNIVKKFNQFDVASCEPSIQRWDSNCQIDKVCDVCDESILSNRLTCPYWGQTVCYKHLSDGTPICCSCKRFKLGNTRYINLSDGRKLCSECRCTSIMDTETCIPLFREVYRFFEGLNMKIIEDIPIFLVDKDEINKIYYSFGGKDQLGYGYPLGMATYRAGLVVQSVARSFQRGEDIHVVKEVQYIQRIYEVTSLLVVYGFPRLAIGATLAHEMMHAWMRIEGYNGLRLEVEEGICEVMAHRWLDWHAFVGDDFLHATPEQAQFLRNLKEVLQNKIERNYCKIYGGGFREAKWAIERYGLKYTMSHVAQTGDFPQ